MWNDRVNQVGWLLIVVVLIVCSNGKCWDLGGAYNISSGYYASSVASYGNRAFLALPRSSCHNSRRLPTLVEVPWFEQQAPKFPSRRKPFFLDDQHWGKCDHIQDATSLDMESVKARLWVLDKGSAKCYAKIIIYNLFQRTNYTFELRRIPHRPDLSTLVLDPVLSLSNSARAYLGFSGRSFLVVFEFNTAKWWKIDLEITAGGDDGAGAYYPENAIPRAGPVSSEFLALSRKEAVLYMTGHRDVFSVRLKYLRSAEDQGNATVQFLGEKLGDSTGLVTDFRDGLSYYLTRYHAIVRWDMRNLLQAEYHNVLAQSYNILPSVSQLYTGPQNGIWALANPRGPFECGPTNETIPELKMRLVKILKYNAMMEKIKDTLIAS